MDLNFCVWPLSVTFWISISFFRDLIRQGRENVYYYSFEHQVITTDIGLLNNELL